VALRAVLDTRFYFSYYNPENGEVASWTRSIVQGILKGELKVASSVITIAELYGTMGRLVGMDAVKLRIASSKASNILFIPITEDIAHIAGEITLRTPKIPLADAIIAATALIHAHGVVVTDDEHFKLVKGIETVWLKSI